MQVASPTKLKTGFIGQGWIGKNYADNYEARGYATVRYSQEASYLENKEKISACDIVFIAVPTPTTPEGFDAGIVREVVGLVGKGKVAVIKSTVPPGTTESIQDEHPDVFLLHSPEFLSERTAKEDVEHPDCNVMGIARDIDVYREKAKMVLETLPGAPNIICTSRESEFIKYTHNIHGFLEIIYANLMYDLAEKLDVQWETVKEFIMHDKLMIARYASPVHASGDGTGKPGRGAGGHCFIKDFAAFRKLYEENLGNGAGTAILRALEKKNIELLKNSGKDLDLLKEVYGS